MSELQPTSPKKLTRSRQDRVIAGVCAGLAQYMNLDPTLVRVGMVLLTVFSGVGALLYLILALVIPEEAA